MHKLLSYEFQKNQPHDNSETSLPKIPVYNIPLYTIVHDALEKGFDPHTVDKHGESLLHTIGCNILQDTTNEYLKTAELLIKHSKDLVNIKEHKRKRIHTICTRNLSLINMCVMQPPV